MQKTWVGEEKIKTEDLRIKIRKRGERMSGAIELVQNEYLIKEFIKTVKKRNEQFLKNKTSPIIGWCNTYVPEEIILAFGITPYRIMGAPTSISLSKAYLCGNISGNVQSLLECALRGDYKFLDGMIIGASTDATKKLFDAWLRYAGTPFNHLFDIPKFIYEGVYKHYRESINSLVEEIEAHFGNKITESSLKEAILVCNKTRVLLTALSNLRKDNNPPISSLEMLEICKLAMVSDKRFFNTELESLLAKIKITDIKNSAYRILLTGSFQDQPWLLESIEENNALVVCEDLCTGLRYYTGLVDEDVEPIEAITKRYIEKKPPSATLVSIDQRADFIFKLINEFKIDGVVYHILKFDDPYLFEFPDMKEFLESKFIPMLRIETEYTTSTMGQVKTRLQAFIETLKFTKYRKIEVDKNG